MNYCSLSTFWCTLVLQLSQICAGWVSFF